MSAAVRHRTVLLAAVASALAVPSAIAGAIGPEAAAKAATKAKGRATAKARKPAAPKIVFVTCSTTPLPCEQSRTTLFRTGRVLVVAKGMTSKARVVFPVRPAGRKAGKRAIAGTLTKGTQLRVRVPGDAVSGAIRVVMPTRRYSNAVKVVVKRPPKPRAATPSTGLRGVPSAFDGNGMWIWYVSKSNGGDPAAIGAQARAHGIKTVYVKSADGTGVWSQFTATLVQALKAQGLNVCAWQFVYGNDPVGEANAGAVAAQRGADCFAIDAEGAYEGKYAQAQRYITQLRAAVGPSFPIGLTSFPYVDYHPGLPYSVFMGSGGATFNLPQVYWKTIGTSVDVSLAHTYQYNGVYQTPIYPLGQTYDGPAASDILRFRQLSDAYGARGVSWWDWQEASTSDWNAVGASLTALTSAPAVAYPTLRRGSKGDLVVWAQEHLVGAGQAIAVDGDFGPGTAAAVSAFQSANGIAATAVIDGATWPALVRTKAVAPDWTGGKASSARAARAGGVTGPASAGLKAKRYEIPPGPSSQPR